MTDSKKKIDGPRGTLQVPAALSREIVVYAKENGTTSYELVREAWNLLRSKNKTAAALKSPAKSADEHNLQLKSLAATAEEIARRLREIADARESALDAESEEERIIREAEVHHKDVEAALGSSGGSSKAGRGDRAGAKKKAG